MKIDIELKEELIAISKNELNKKLLLCENSLKDITEGIQYETKSSAGDKFETAREMMQQEREKLELQVNKLKSKIHQLDQIIAKICSKVEHTALVKTLNEYFFFIPFFGSIDHEGKKIYTIEINSPIGQVLKDMKKNERTSFRGKEYVIEEII